MEGTHHPRSEAGLDQLAFDVAFGQQRRGQVKVQGVIVAKLFTQTRFKDWVSVQPSDLILVLDGHHPVQLCCHHLGQGELGAG